MAPAPTAALACATPVVGSVPQQALTPQHAAAVSLANGAACHIGTVLTSIKAVTARYPAACPSGGSRLAPLYVLRYAAQPLIALRPRLKLGAHGLDQPSRLSRTYAQPNTKRVC